MLVGLVPLAIAMIGVGYAALILRNAHRRDNLVFGGLVLLDAAITVWRGLNVMTGASIVATGVLIPCAIGTVLLALVTYEFLAGFPNHPPMRWPTRTLLWLWGASAVAMTLFPIPGPWGRQTFVELGFFMPAALGTLLLSVRAYRRATGRDERVVIVMLAFRWLAGTGAYAIAPLFGYFEEIVWAETIVASVIGFVVIGTTVLRTELFSLRNTFAEVVTIATLVLLVVLGAGGAIAFSLAYAAPGRPLYLALFGASLVPLALGAIAQNMYPRVERRVLAPLDERRARRLGVQGDPIPADAAAAIAEATQRIAQFGDGSTVRWVPAKQLPPELATALVSAQQMRREETPDLPAAFIVAAIGAEKMLVGAFYIDNGTIDRDTYLVARDLAARVALSVERAQAVSELEDARRLAALGQFAAAIAHDIRTPLTSISLNVQILRRKLALPDDDREHFDIALEELARLDRSVAEILDFAKPVKLTAEEIDVGELLADAAKGLTPVLLERGVSLVCSPADALTIHGDAQRLRQVLANLVGNAADASERGASVRVRAAATDGHIAIDVEDTGRGIGADDLPHIFDPFFTTRPDGTGLGLAICHKVIRAHGGDIRVRSTPGKGSTFTVTLPAA